MALRLNYTHNIDLVITNAYVRIKKLIIEYNPELASSLGGNKRVGRPYLEVKFEKNKNFNVEWNDERWVFPLMAGQGDAETQAYNYLKTQPGFEVATNDND
jgi:hypothetical protein